MTELEIQQEVERQYKILSRGCDEIINEKEFKNKLEKSIDLIASKTYNKVSEYLLLEDYRKLLSKIVKSDNLPKFFGTSLKSILSLTQRSFLCLSLKILSSWSSLFKSIDFPMFFEPG